MTIRVPRASDPITEEKPASRQWLRWFGAVSDVLNGSTDPVESTEIAYTNGRTILTSGTSFELPSIYRQPIYVKNATGNSITVSPASGFTLYGSASGQTSINMLDGEAFEFVLDGVVWYVF